MNIWPIFIRWPGWHPIVFLSLLSHPPSTWWPAWWPKNIFGNIGILSMLRVKWPNFFLNIDIVEMQTKFAQNIHKMFLLSPLNVKSTATIKDTSGSFGILEKLNLRKIFLFFLRMFTRCFFTVLDFEHSFWRKFSGWLKSPSLPASDPEILITRLKSNITN